MAESPAGTGAVGQVNTHLSVGRYALPVCADALIASGDYKSVDPTAVEFPTLGATGVVIFLNVTAQTGAGNTITLNVDAFDPVSNSWLALPHTTAAPVYTAGTGSLLFIVDPRIPGVQNKVTQCPVPGRLRVRPVGSGTRTTLNYSVGAALCL
jgi:hypothetical protein